VSSLSQAIAKSLIVFIFIYNSSKDFLGASYLLIEENSEGNEKIITRIYEL